MHAAADPVADREDAEPPVVIGVPPARTAPVPRMAALSAAAMPPFFAVLPGATPCGADRLAARTGLPAGRMLASIRPGTPLAAAGMVGETDVADLPGDDEVRGSD